MAEGMRVDVDRERDGMKSSKAVYDEREFLRWTALAAKATETFDGSPMQIVLRSEVTPYPALLAALRESRVGPGRDALRIAALRAMTPERVRELIAEVVASPEQASGPLMMLIKHSLLDFSGALLIARSGDERMIRELLVEGMIPVTCNPEQVEELFAVMNERGGLAPPIASILFVAVDRFIHLPSVLSRQISMRARLLAMVQALPPEARDAVIERVESALDLRGRYPTLVRK
jgi:hypothetical protein